MSLSALPAAPDASTGDGTIAFASRYESAPAPHASTRGVCQSVAPAARWASAQAARIAAWRCAVAQITVAPAASPAWTAVGSRFKCMAP